jgi:predicted DNA-binding transcriptional regulator AlpA
MTRSNPADISVLRRFLTEAQVADVTHISQRTLQKWRLFGHGPRYVKLRGAVRYEWADVEAWIESCPVGGGEAA